MRKVELDYQPGYYIVPGSGPWRIIDERGQIIASAINANDAVTKAAAFGALHVKYTQSALNQTEVIQNKNKTGAE